MRRGCHGDLGAAVVIPPVNQLASRNLARMSNHAHCSLLCAFGAFKVDGALKVLTYSSLNEWLSNFNTYSSI